MGKMFNEFSNLKFVTLMIQAASMVFLFPREVVKYQKYPLNSGLWAALRAGFFSSFIPVIEDSGVKLEQNE